MCGFILAPEAYQEKVGLALDAMSYRGADGFRGQANRGGWTLGHVRLAIQTDADFGAQPFENERSAVAFVGEIFSYRGVALQGSEEETLRDVLRSPNLGEFMHLDGFWSIAEIDEYGYARVLTDHLGIKPVYFWKDLNIFCSELEPMFVLAGFRPELEEVYLSNCLKFGYDYSGRTPYQGIFQVAPGTAMVHDSWRGTSEPVKYWDWKQVDYSYAVQGYGGEGVIHDLLTEATLHRAWAVKHRDVGLLLSGGLDSTIIYSILRLNGLLEKVEIFSVENDESKFLPEGVTYLNSPALPTPAGAVHVMQAPLDLGSLYPQIQLANALGRKNIRVCLTGDGADEVFGGYRRSLEYDSQASDVFCELPYYHLPRLDRVHMRNTTEIRSPFLSPAVVAFGLNLPRADRTGKAILKRAFSRQVPKDILERPKHPLKGPHYLTNPLEHRAQLVEAFRNDHS